MHKTEIARRHLDERVASARRTEFLPPHRGWVRAIRDSLGMSSTDLGRRMGISQQAVAEVEKNEARGSVRLDTLQRAAEAMECELVYAIVPRTSLEDIVHQRARAKARVLALTAAHHSRLEDQSTSEEELQLLIDEIADELVDRRGLWKDIE